MSIVEYKAIVEYGDRAIIFVGMNHFYPLVVQRGQVMHSKYGAFPHDWMVGKTFGSKIWARNNKGWLYILHPTAELWTLSLLHRTQVIYSTDISMIISELEIMPGCLVIESGTGSGSLSHAIIRAVSPNGKLLTYEFHNERADKAENDFKLNGLNHLVTVHCRNVCQEGFDITSEADAVILDLPIPWEAIPYAKQALKPGGRICCFSPCIEQVQRSCMCLRDHGFIDVKVLETILRPYRVKKMELPIANTGNCESFQSNERSDPSTSHHENKSKRELLSTFPVATTPGHTGYLTFATFYPQE
ncbi:tRNA (adenine(58)-N(1))-methyltransferase catalytic subunit TRMT61A [Trichoplax sp. H2]|uniref:tRNA (adenine(58)-N(1))-methyltransferase catalytic subunit TRMT61A n=1 Tax=Trichoplax adhaerens TaxID=10228 RepID=B3S082_TRIAD|nr:hypothetical protein TRIADDRAFT_50434 [Trichoplax adhaerens]EDV23962.1 hypothetical protein TRIADDRAFT_50434 [Trichoplax adhaerens]RDD39393.1 tRNA (adenine(58)-N(1))-methyltransferase catalytic subunit TRMT61A [Trichoplax sp. H2]|eukprot:XP_002113488.1 hypothetical protein TRIADDRAFT_50434 [Trichoplax adhaerens]